VPVVKRRQTGPVSRLRGRGTNAFGVPVFAFILLVAGHNTAGRFAGLFSIYVAVCAIGFAIFSSAIVAVALRYRGAERARRRKASAPRLEAAYVAVLVVIAAGLYGLTLRTEGPEDALAGTPRLTVHVTASQWQWRFRYPGGVVSQGPGARLVVPTGVIVQVDLRSADVLHSMWVPALRFKRYAYPGYTNRFDLDVPHELRTWGRCAQFCGLGHDTMRFRVIAVSPRRFQTWLRSRSVS
jgi:cytochrome c oxidase subunit 2